jgi:Rrf2 family protein
LTIKIWYLAFLVRLKSEFSIFYCQFAFVLMLKISAKTEYACIAVMELALQREAGGLVQLRTISEKQSVPPRFLVQILLQLKDAGIVESIRGATGGYRLKKRPEEVTLGEVMNVIDPPVGGQRTLTQTGGKSSAAVVMGCVWGDAEQHCQNYLNKITFAELIKACSS